MLLSFAFSVGMLALKMTGYLITGSNSVLSDAAESVVHVLAVGFSVFGVHLSMKPPDDQHHYGHERIGFFAVGIEGLVINVAGISILYQSVRYLILGIAPDHLEQGMLYVGLAGIGNLILGLYVMKVGKELNDMILIGNAKHTLTDVYTSGGVVVTLLLIKFTGFEILDALVGIALAAFIMLEGGKLLVYAINGLMDKRDPERDKEIRAILDEPLPQSMKSVHSLRHRTTGKTTWIEFHATFDKQLTLDQAHASATKLEKKLMNTLKGDAVVTIHLEPEETHDESHKILKGINKNDALDTLF